MDRHRRRSRASRHGTGGRGTDQRNRGGEAPHQATRLGRHPGALRGLPTSHRCRLDRQAGHTVGYESFTGIFYPKRDRAKIWVTYALKGGSITTVEHINGAESRSSGAILSGTGKYKGITGTLTARQALHNERKSYIVLKYRFCSTACAPAPR